MFQAQQGGKAWPCGGKAAGQDLGKRQVRCVVGNWSAVVSSSVSFSWWGHFMVAEGLAMARAAAEERVWQREAQDGGDFEGRAGTCLDFGVSSPSM